MEIASTRTDDIINYVNNTRIHSDTQVNQIAASIAEFSFCNPILIDESNVIIAGHARLSAAKKLKLEEVPTITLSHLSEAQKKAYIIADNQLPNNAEWDLDLLKVELERLGELDFDIDLIGLDEMFLNNLDGDFTDKDAEWEGMPEFINSDLDPDSQIIISFRNEDDRKAFGKLLKQKITENTKSVWYPEAEIESAGTYE